MHRLKHSYSTVIAIVMLALFMTPAFGMDNVPADDSVIALVAMVGIEASLPDIVASPFNTEVNYDAAYTVPVERLKVVTETYLEVLTSDDYSYTVTVSMPAGSITYADTSATIGDTGFNSPHRTAYGPSASPGVFATGYCKAVMSQSTASLDTRFMWTSAHT